MCGRAATGLKMGLKPRRMSEMTNPERKHGHPLRTLVIHTEGPGHVWDRSGEGPVGAVGLPWGQEGCQAFERSARMGTEVKPELAG